MCRSDRVFNPRARPALDADGVSERALEGSAEDLARWLSGSG